MLYDHIKQRSPMSSAVKEERRREVEQATVAAAFQ